MRRRERGLVEPLAVGGQRRMRRAVDGGEPGLVSSCNSRCG